ncbi:hypothetical protein JWG41_16245 [Leptospira sp. 201903075]|uniref:hypothetical protein n=1 Tax=Leptospira chreensis TaxID=2810035 RepID=UPI0019624941|nr:hypothetical protein [Leptospira chreensis]MBM9591780.1 hypothetical protein [Leptospira chreensis]MBM9592000.1 hypothetical protein [Leptospira chreensis]
MLKTILSLVSITYLFVGCYSYMGKELPNRLNEKLTPKTGPLSFTINTSDLDDKALFETIVETNLKNTNLFDKVTKINAGDKKETTHLDIYVFPGNTYQNGWITGMSSFFMGITFGLLPGIAERNQVWDIDVYHSGKQTKSFTFTQSKNTFLESSRYSFIYSMINGM